MTVTQTKLHSAVTNTPPFSRGCLPASISVWCWLLKRAEKLSYCWPRSAWLSRAYINSHLLFEKKNNVDSIALALLQFIGGQASFGMLTCDMVSQDTKFSLWIARSKNTSASAHTLSAETRVFLWNYYAQQKDMPASPGWTSSTWHCSGAREFWNEETNILDSQ